MPGTTLTADMVVAHSHLLRWQGPVLLGVYLSAPMLRDSGHFALQAQRVSCTGSKPIVVILISLVSGWFGIRRVMQSCPMRSLCGDFLGTAFSLIKGDAWKEILLLFFT